MKKEYTAPLVKYLAFSVEEAIAQDSTGWQENEEGPGIGSKPWNDGELGWT